MFSMVFSKFMIVSPLDEKTWFSEPFSSWKLNKNVPSSFRGLDRLIARSKVVKNLKELGNLDKIEKITHSVPYGDRSGSLVEPYLTDQWFLDVKELAKKAIIKVKKKETEFFPKSWTKVFYSWMSKIEPWCISRQI